MWLHGRVRVDLVDLPCFGRRSRLVWSKRRWRCPARECPVATFVETNDRIATERAGIADRAGAVTEHGAVLIDDPTRIAATTAIGLDEVLFRRFGRFRQRQWSTQIVGVAQGQLLDLVGGP